MRPCGFARVKKAPNVDPQSVESTVGFLTSEGKSQEGKEFIVWAWKLVMMPSHQPGYQKS